MPSYGRQRPPSWKKLRSLPTRCFGSRSMFTSRSRECSVGRWVMISWRARVAGSAGVPSRRPRPKQREQTAPRGAGHESAGLRELITRCLARGRTKPPFPLQASGWQPRPRAALGRAKALRKPERSKWPQTHCFVSITSQVPCCLACFLLSQRGISSGFRARIETVTSGVHIMTVRRSPKLRDCILSMVLSVRCRTAYCGHMPLWAPPIMNFEGRSKGRHAQR